LTERKIYTQLQDI